MTTGEHTVFEKKVSAKAVRMRWMTCNCTQIQLPDGTTIVVDPFLPPQGHSHPMWNKSACGMISEDLERVDYILINHSHADHIATLDALYAKFEPIVFCHPIIAMELCERMNIPFSKIIPIDNDMSYDFGAFRLETYLAKHVAPKNPPLPSVGGVPDKGTPLETLNKFGTIFNTNFIITTPNGLRIGFGPGLIESLENEHWDKKNIDVLLRQYYPADRPIERKKSLEEEFADELDFVGAPLAWPIHHETTYVPGNPYDEMNEFTEKVNGYLKARGSVVRMQNPERNKWYTLSVGLELAEA